MAYGFKQIWLRVTPERRTSLCLLLASLFLSACAATTSPDPNSPRTNEPPYPVLMTETPERREAALSAWTRFAREQGMTNPPLPEFQRVTATISSLPPNISAPLYLPKVGDSNPMTEEDTRESLRRYIASAGNLVGARPHQLSLIQRIDAADGTKKAIYEQRPFRYPLRGGYGKLEITFAPDRRILQIHSTSIPEVEQLQRAGAGTRPRSTSDQLPEKVVGRSFTFTDESGAQQTFALAQDEKLTVRELVIYPIARATQPATLEFHLAWEIKVDRAGSSLNIYLDAVTEEIIAVESISK
jgi:hypothetical protein